MGAGISLPVSPQLSEKDYANLVLIQRNISARDGVSIEGVGYPLGTLDDHAALAAALLGGGAGGTAVIASAGQIAVLIARQAVRVGRWALEKIKGKDEPPPGKNVATEGANPSGVGAAAAEAAASALSAREKIEATQSQSVARTNLSADHVERSSKLISEKVSGYLLNPEHEDGRSKARWFNDALGIGQSNAELLAKQIVFDEKQAVVSRETIYGIRYKLVIEIRGANGRTLPITTIWQRDTQDGFVRFLTATPGVR